MWGHPPFYISDNLTVEVQNLEAARAWYKDRLGLRDSRVQGEDDSGQPCADLELSGGGLVRLIEAEPGSSDARARTTAPRPILFASKLEKAHEWLTNRGIPVGPITSDSGGNRLFQFQDLDGNLIEVCKEP